MNAAIARRGAVGTSATTRVGSSRGQPGQNPEGSRGVEPSIVKNLEQALSLSSRPGRGAHRTLRKDGTPKWFRTLYPSELPHLPHVRTRLEFEPILAVPLYCANNYH